MLTIKREQGGGECSIQKEKTHLSLFSNSVELNLLGLRPSIEIRMKENRRGRRQWALWSINSNLFAFHRENIHTNTS